MAEVSIHQNSAPESQEMRAVTPRSICAAIGIIVLTVLWDEWMPYYMAGSNISRSHFPLALLFPFVALAVFNMLTRLAIPSLALNTLELRVVLGMGLAAAIIPYDGVTGHT
jgi:hypothetical protein